MALSPLDLSVTTLRALSGNWVRSGLTALGIFMGVAAVNATLNIEAISRQVMADRLASMESPSFLPFIYAEDRPDPQWDAATIAQVKRAVPEVIEISQSTWTWNKDVLYLDRKTPEPASIQAVSVNHQQATGRRILEGRFFDAADFDNYRAVAIVDDLLTQQLFEGESPLGKSIFVGSDRFTIIGVIENKKFWEEEKPSSTIWITMAYATLLAESYMVDYSYPKIALRSLDNYEKIQQDLEDNLKEMFPGYEVDLWGNVEGLYEEQQQQQASIRVLKAVGLLALVIGGVGIANITIAAIMERTREIGLRRAIGATDLEIMAQFIAEAALLSLIGGTAAVVAVHFATQAATTRIFEAPYQFRPQDAALSMGAAFVIGVGSSLLPALRITRIDVVQALRGE
jgi:putative ABC transport system permease protein